MKILIFAMILTLLVSFGIYIANLESKDATPTIQYTSPIGPSQEYPYILESESLIDGNK